MKKTDVSNSLLQFFFTDDKCLATDAMPENGGNVDIVEEAATSEKASAEFQEKAHQFPLGRVKNIMKMDSDVNLASKDAVFLITKSLEMFVENLAIEAYTYTSQTKKKTLSRQDVEKAIDAVDALAFLDGALQDE